MLLHTTTDIAHQHRDDLLTAAAEERLARQAGHATRRGLLARLRRPARPVATVTPVTVAAARVVPATHTTPDPQTTTDTVTTAA